MADIDHRDSISADAFRTTYFRHKRPVLLTGFARTWPAMTKWSFEFFAEQAAPQPVYVEQGNVLQSKTAFVAVDFPAYIRSVIAASPTDAGTQRGGQRYLSLFNVFAMFPHLRSDVDFSLLENLTLFRRVFGWLGPAGTITGFHIDWIDNLLAQIHGRKRLWLVSPQDQRGMYPSRKYDYRSTLSSIDPDSYDRKRYPLFEQVRRFEVILEPGDALYIPRGWWHRVESLSPSISVNNFGHDLSGLLTLQTRALVLDCLHQLGLYGSDCTCHQLVDGRRVAR